MREFFIPVLLQLAGVIIIIAEIFLALSVAQLITASGR